MAALLRGYQPNVAFKMWFAYPLALVTNFHFRPRSRFPRFFLQV